MNARQRRIEDPALLRGNIPFVADLHFAGMLEAVVVRSIYAHAMLDVVNVQPALESPGVKTVVTAMDLPSACGPIPMRLSPSSELEAALQYPLARDRVRFVGEPIAVIVAGSRYEAEDARPGVEVRYRPLTATTNVRQAMKNPVLFDTLDSNQVYQHRQYHRLVESKEPDPTLRQLHLSFSIQRHTAMPLETRGLVAVPEDGRITVYGATKVLHFNRRVLAGFLGLDVTAVRLVEVAVGGGFGVRGEFYPEDYLIPWLALRLQRPVRWIEDRLEHLQAANHSRQQEHEVDVSYDDTGRIYHLHDEIIVDTGAYIRTHGVTVPELTQGMLPGPYRWQEVDTQLRVVLTNKTPTGTYRGPGRFEGTFVRERVMDAIASTLHLDPLTVRQKNLLTVDTLPFSHGMQALGEEIVWDSGDYPLALAQAAHLMAKEEFPRRRAAASARGRRRGLGFAMFVEKSGLGPWEDCRVAVDADGRFTCWTGLSTLGQGTMTALTRILAETWGVSASQIRIVHGDTDQVPESHGTFASRATVMGGSAAFYSARTLKSRLQALAAPLLEAHPEDVILTDRGAEVTGVPTVAVSYKDLVEESVRQALPLDVTERFSASAMTYPYGVHGCELEVCPNTGMIQIVRYGVVYDVGRAVDRDLVKDQIVGGVAQGIGGALLEELAYDEQGQLVTGTLMDYLLPGFCDVPEIAVMITEVAPATSNPLGIKGAGEGGAVGVAPAIANALADALNAPPEAFTTLPLRPQDILRWSRMDQLPRKGAKR